jgi:hypothetical protein
VNIAQRQAQTGRAYPRRPPGKRHDGVCDEAQEQKGGSGGDHEDGRDAPVEGEPDGDPAEPDEGPLSVVR